MPALATQNPGVSAIATFESLLNKLLDEAEQLKPYSTIDSESSALEAPLTKSDFQNLSQRVDSSLSSIAGVAGEEDSEDGKIQVKSRRLAIIESAARDIFGSFVASTPIDTPEFGRLWHLFDILSILSDNGQCDPALLFWLVEELLDSQTIAGCRLIFDYLESRRERITAKHFKAKHLVILRSCNELLRRLSRAKDTAFCGRVFIFLFQSFPLGDRSSVNLRGEYHIENVTTYEDMPADDGSKMDVDPQVNDSNVTNAKADAKDSTKPKSSDELYHLFWPLQDFFSQPLKLFDPSNLGKFKKSIEETVKKFQTCTPENISRSASLAESTSSSLKRKRDEVDHADTFNPKYLTSKDLFDLEISDLTFRRHILTQTLIVLNFIQSWTHEAKEKYASMNASNKAVIYNDEFSAQDAQWAKETKEKIADYIRQDHSGKQHLTNKQPGKFYYRMVDTIITRDKNWVYWKMLSCSPIEKKPVEPETFADAQSAAERLATSKRLRPVPMGAVPLDFLQPPNERAAFDEFRRPERYEIPELDGFQHKIADDDFEISTPRNDQAKAAAIAGKSSKSWRALRIASRCKLAAFDKIDDSQKIDVVFQELKDIDDQVLEDEPSEEDMPSNRDSIVVSGPPGAGKSALISKLIEEHKGVFVRVVRHTTREPAEGEVNGKDFHFVKAQEFNQLRDGDRLIEHGERDGADYGTSTKVIDAITESGKVPIVELDLEATQYAKDMDFTARYILVKPSNNELLQERLKSAGKDDAAIQTIIDKLPEQLDESKVSELFDRTVVNDVLEEAFKALDEHVFAKDGDTAKDAKDVEDDAVMEQPAVPEEEKQMDVDEKES